VPLIGLAALRRALGGERLHSTQSIIETVKMLGDTDTGIMVTW